MSAAKQTTDAPAEPPVVTGSFPTVDPYADAGAHSPVRFLYDLNPLAKIFAPLPAMLLMLAVRDVQTPLVFVVLSYALLIVGVRLTPALLGLLAGIPLVAAVLALGFSAWTDPGLVDDTAPVFELGGWTLYSGAVSIGVATGVRIAAIVMLAFIAGLSTTGPDLVRATVQQLRVPYRIGYTALAAFRFVPRFRHELEVIRQAHRVRGARGGRGPLASLARWTGYIVPLLAGGIRHAERVALAMDSRAFGAHPDRTERHLVPWRVRDTVFVIAFWLVTAAVMWVFFPWGWA